MVGMVMLSNLVLAQEKLDKLFTQTTPVQRAEFQTKKMQEKLNLNADQKTKMYDLNLKYAQKMQDAYKSESGKMQRLRKMKEIGEAKDGEVKTILTDSQYKIYEQNKESIMKATTEELTK
jgi:Spy/CpxP family protein refolding chaperone